MAFLDKLNEVAKKVGDKTNEVAKIVGDRAGDAIETGKLSAKISAEKIAMTEDIRKIGEYYFSRFMEGEEPAPEVLGYYNSAKAHFDEIEACKNELKLMKEQNGEEDVVAVYEETHQDGIEETQPSI